MKKKLSRRGALKAGAGAAALTGALGIMPRYISPARAATGLAEGMTGGPTGFPGAERFQYNESMSEGRAIEGIKKLKAAGKAPEKISILLTDGAIGQLTKPFPPGAPTVMDVWKAETGIDVEIVGAPAGDIWKRVLQDVTTSSGAYDIYTHPWNSVGDLVEAGGAHPLNEFVEKYQPDWGDPNRGTPSSEIETLLYKYKGDYYSVSLDGDFQTWVYNRWAFERPEYQKEFADKYGYQLGHPRTWEECDNISAFFTGKTGIDGNPMYGNGNMLSPFWGLSTFYMRFASMDNPNFYWFDESGKPNLNTDQGILAATEHKALKQWSHPDILT
ncbi:MAG: extracellular solute-binding protein [Pseudomonadota bacterium]